MLSQIAIVEAPIEFELMIVETVQARIAMHLLLAEAAEIFQTVAAPTGIVL
jgi:hypothetical protein